MDNASTKADILLFKADFAQVESRLEAKIEAVQSKLIMWFVSTQIAFVAIVAALIKL